MRSKNNRVTDSKNSTKIAFLASIPVMAGYIVLGIAFGILLADKGYHFGWAILMSVLIYAGSMQFVTINLLTGGASLISAGIMTLLVNARHIFYGISMLNKYKDMGKAKGYLIFSLTDETFALVCGGAPTQTEPRKYYFWVSFFNQCYWIIGSTIGALVGSAITFNTAGIDFAMTALFVTIFVEQLLACSARFPAIAGVLCSVICLLLFGTEKFLIPSMFAITIVLLLYGKVHDNFQIRETQKSDKAPRQFELSAEERREQL